MEDPEVVAAIVAGDPAGLAEAYDRYAMPLYSYCRSMLREPADAADAVQDTFLVATAKLRDLRDPAKLRSWLYAVARNECMRRLRAGSALSALEEAADVPAQAAEIGTETERVEVQQLVRAAIDGLNPGERDVIELSLISELENDELADALGVSRNHAHALLSRARSQLERSLGALIVARTGRAACSDLDAMLAGWDGQLTVLMRKRISRHIEHCEVCGEVHSPGGRQPVFQCLQRESRNGASLSPASPVRLPGSRRSGRSLELGNHLDVPLEKSSRGHRRFDSLNPGADSVFHLPFFARGRCSGSQPATAPGVLRLHQLNRHLHCDGTQAGLNFQAARMGRCQGVGEIRL